MEDTVQREAERVDIACRGERLGLQLLGAGVTHGKTGRGITERCCPCLVQKLTGAKVEQLGAVLRRDQDVGWLEVAVQDEVAMSFDDGFAELLQHRQKLACADLRIIRKSIDTLAVDVLHGDVGSTVRGCARIQQARDAGVCKAGKGIALVQEGRHRGAAGMSTAENLDGRVADNWLCALEAWISGLRAGFITHALSQIHHAHATAAHNALQSIPACNRACELIFSRDFGAQC